MVAVITICLFNEDGTPSGLKWNGQKQEDEFQSLPGEHNHENRYFWWRMQLKLVTWLRKNAD